MLGSRLQIGSFCSFTKNQRTFATAESVFMNLFRCGTSSVRGPWRSPISRKKGIEAMKANVEKIGLKVGESIGNGIECAASFRVGGTVHRREVQTLLGDQHLDAAAHRILGEFEETSVECGIVILRSSILY